MLKFLTDTMLDLKLKSLTREDRKLTRELLEHIAEVDRRQLYLKMNFPSLFSYLTIELGYTNGSAQRRIDGARLIRRVPEVAEQIQNGALNLSQISKLQVTCREVAKTSGEKVTAQTQRQIQWQNSKSERVCHRACLGRGIQD
jgi:hypothetical protein